MLRFKHSFFIVGLVSCFGLGSVMAQDDTATEESNALVDSGLTVEQSVSLDDLLEKIQQRRVVENQMHSQRLREFQNAADEQKRMLDDANDTLEQEHQRGKNLEAQQAENGQTIIDRTIELNEQLGTLKELFGVLQQVSGDAVSVFNGSIVSAEYEGREVFLSELAQKMGTATELATIEELEHVLYLLQQHIIETGRVSKFNNEVNTNAGDNVPTDLIRVGAFNLVTSSGYVSYDTSLEKITELPRQPSGEFSNTARALSRAKPGDVVAFAIDPTRGGLLFLETQRATLPEMVGTPFGGIASGSCYLPFCDGQGEYVGSIIIMVGILGVVLALYRMTILFFVGRRVNAQKADLDNAKDDNPLGRLLHIYQSNKGVDSETLQLKMGEGILSEMPALTRNISLVQVISVVAPLMGLLGTVIGMIKTFQAITLFGTGDPKIMAGGISVALMTTVLGLCVAIPTVLLHALTAQFSRSVIHVLDEQSEGLIAQHAEEKGEPITEA